MIKTITLHAALQKIRARTERLRLIVEMGCTCIDCGETDPYMLTFHHPNGRLWEPNTLNQAQRMRYYRQDWEADDLQLLCGRCNTVDGNRYRAKRKKQVTQRRKLTGKSRAA